jgi:hypothetical protein
MKFDEDSRKFIEDGVEVPEEIDVIDGHYDIPIYGYVAVAIVVSQMGETQGYGVLYWEHGNTDEEYPDTSPTYRSATGDKKIAIKDAIRKAERENARLSENVLEWYP